MYFTQIGQVKNAEDEKRAQQILEGALNDNKALTFCQGKDSNCLGNLQKIVSARMQVLKDVQAKMNAVLNMHFFDLSSQEREAALNGFKQDISNNVESSLNNLR